MPVLVFQVKMEIQDSKEPLATQVHKELLDQLDHQGLLVRLVQVEIQEQQGSLEGLDLQDQLGLLDLLVSKEMLLHLTSSMSL